MVTATYDGTKATLYVNGAIVAGPTAVAAPSGSSSLAPTIGYYGGSYFTGLMDDVREYNGALSAAEVQELYEAGIATLISAPGPTEYASIANWSER
jgi:hypothetical protein